MRRLLASLAAAALLACAGTAWGQQVERSASAPSVVREGQGQDGQAPVVERSAQEGRRVASETGKTPPAAPERSMALGWESYSQGDFPGAFRQFEEALGQATGQAALQARLGLGFTALRMGNLERARQELQVVADAGYRLPESLPALLTALRALGDRQALDRMLALLPEAERSNWQSPAPPEQPPAAPASTTAVARDEGVRRDLARAGTRPTPEKLLHLLKVHAAALGGCAEGDVFLKIGQELAAQTRAAEARGVFDKLLACPRLDFGVRLGAFYGLASLEAPEAVRARLAGFRASRPPLPPAGEEALRKLALALDRQEMGQPGVSQTRKLELARAILAADPADADARAALAWDDLAQGRAGQAQRTFRALAGEHPGRLDFQLGLGYANYHLGLLDEALGVAASSGAPDDPSMKNLTYQVHVKRAFQALDAKDPAQAEAHAARARAVWPAGGEVREVEAWAAQARGVDAKALAGFSERYEATGDKRFLGPMAQGFARTGQRVQAFRTAAGLARDEAAESRAAAATFYAGQDTPILAAATGAGGCCANADTAFLDALGFVRSKTGDSGLSRLTEWSAPARFSWALPSGMRFTAGYSAHFLSSGNAPASPYAGSYYARVADTPQRNPLVTDLTVHTPGLSLDVEGPYRWRVDAGLTPLGGPVWPLPTFGVAVSTPDWEVAIHQKPVTESILSWVGQRDPYGSRTWGRVLRTGGKARITFAPGQDWFLSLGGGADHLWGENVAGNTGLTGNAAAGRSFRIKDNELSLGAFATVKHFAVNSNFYTFGHGGYYSPELLFIAGPFVRFRTPSCRDYWIDMEGSVGFLYERTADAPKYPLGASVHGLGSSQVTELGGSYQGKTETKLAYSARGEALKLLTPHLAAGVFGGVSNASDYTEAWVGAGLRVSFEPQKGFWAPKDLFRRQTPFDRE